MRELISFMESKGFSCPELQPDGKFYRFGCKDSAWAVAWSNARISTGEHYIVANFGDFRTQEKHVYKPTGLSRDDEYVVKRQLADRAEAMAKEREQNYVVVAIEAERRFNANATTGRTAYMDRKQMPELYGCRIYKDTLQIPARDVDGRIWSIQSVFNEPIMLNGSPVSKIFMKGGRKKGCFHVIGEPLSENLAEAYLGEGIATMASVHQATGKTCIVGFDCGNMVEVAQEVSARYPHLALTVCGDIDPAGTEKAEKAALISSGMIKYPEFPEGSRGTDYNDLHVLVGLEEVRRQLIGAPPEKRTGFISLGYNEGTYFFYHIPSRDLVKCTSFVDVQMFALAPMDYWQSRYIGKKGGIDYTQAKHDLIQDSREIGPFNPNRVRGSGVWRDNDRTVVNTGHTLFVEGREIGLASLPSWYIYVQTVDRLPPLHKNPLTAEEGRKIARICQSFKWKNKTDGMLLSGWVGLARVASALDIRPHIWLTGGKGTGKSTIMEQLIAPLLGSPKAKLHLIGASTEAGIRQELAYSARPVIYDEFESTNPASQMRIESNLELFRNAWSHSEGRVLKGSAGGKGVEFCLNFCVLVSSIRVKLDNDADKSRFAVLELMEHGSSPEQWRDLYEELITLDEEMGERLFARFVKYFDALVASQKIIAKFLAMKKSQRYGQQYGTLLAGNWILENDMAITEIQAESLANDFVDMSEENSKDDEMSDEDECLNYLLTKVIDLGSTTSDSKVQISIAEAIKSKTTPANGAEAEWLVRFGIRVKGDQVYVASKHTELSKIFRGTKWATNWNGSLSRIPGTKPTNTMAFGGRDMKSRAISIPLDLI